MDQKNNGFLTYSLVLSIEKATQKKQAGPLTAKKGEKTIHLRDSSKRLAFEDYMQLHSIKRYPNIPCALYSNGRRK